VALFSANLSLMGFVLVPIAPVSYTFSVELTYPSPESISNGMMILVGKMYGFILGLIAGALSNSSPLYALIPYFLNTIVSSVAAIFI
jgi:hypothetical protein